MNLAAQAAPGLKLHVPSPDWRDQVIYFVLTDRFDDGDPRNNDQGAGEFDPQRRSHYSGGDFKGLQRRLGYIRGLGATALWVTPPVANQWWNRSVNYGGYHGYWATDFSRVDPHLGSLADYQRLSSALHRRGMFLVQDIVLNHTANFFAYQGPWQRDDPARNFVLQADTQGRSAPTQWPFCLNDARQASHRRAGIYHFTPDVSDFSQPEQEHNFQMAGLDDLNSESPRVRRALRQSHGDWIRKAGVDAFRVDTAFYVPTSAIDDFLHARDPREPGVLEVARRTGRRDFLVFGEGFALDRAQAETSSRKIESYMHAADGRRLMGGMLNFPLYGTAGDVFARGRSPAELGHRIEAMVRLHPRLHWMPSFLDNHDVDRFLAGGSTAALKQNLLLLMTLPGIPTLYYGTEQGFTESRAAMFAAGWGSQGRDHFDTAAPLYRFIQGTTALRRQHRLFSRGRPTVLAANAATPGVLAYRMQHGGDAALVLFNTADASTLAHDIDTGASPGSRLRPLFSIEGPAADAVVGANGRLSLALPARSGMVWKLPAAGPRPSAAAAAPAGRLRIDDGPVTVTGDFQASGQAEPGQTLQLVVDGDLATAQTLQADASGRWQATVDTRQMMEPALRHSLVAWSAAQGEASPPLRFQVQREWTLRSDVADPSGDDHGPGGSYRYPNNPTWGANRQLDIERVRVFTAGGALRVEVTVPAVTTVWNPPNGFDHVAFTLFIALPGVEGGSTLMPLQNASLPGGLRWHYRLRAHGWSNALFSAEGASATQEGRIHSPAPRIEVNEAERRISFQFSPAALGNRQSLSGLKLYLNTWDYDSGYRRLDAAAGESSFGGGVPQGPLVMDDIAIITLP